MASRKRRDRVAAEELAQIELQFPGLQALCDAKSIDAILPKRPVATSEQSLLVLKGMHVTEPNRRQA